VHACYDSDGLVDAVSRPDSLQRAFGQLSVSVKRRGPLSVLDGLRQAGCLKARFPRPDDAAWLNVVTLNTSGGIAGGDTLDSRFEVGAGARATIASQAAERYYRALPGTPASNVATRIIVADGGAAEWLPQETILFDSCAVRRRLRIALADDAWFLGVESLVFGRAAMGEAVEHASLRDVYEMRRGGRLLLHDAIRLEGEVAATLRRPAIADGAHAVATLVYVARDAETMLDPLRSQGMGASAWDGMLIARMLAADGATLRARVIDALRVLRGGRPLPRVWQC
jgi:urease accessory protein